MNAPKSYFFKGQLLHGTLLAGLLLMALALTGGATFDGGSFLQIDTKTWFVASLAVPVVHQVFVWLAWRSQLCWSAISRKFGPGKFGPRGFVVYGLLFGLFFLCRFLAPLGLGIADRGSIEMPVPLRVILAALLAAPALYALYSVFRYFGYWRAIGIDHFDASYRNLPLVKEGIFRFTSNAMYTCAFLIFWAIAVACGSRAALVAALFSHAYIWVHYFCTERPDMQLIYGRDTSA